MLPRMRVKTDHSCKDNIMLPLHIMQFDARVVATEMLTDLYEHGPIPAPDVKFSSRRKLGVGGLVGSHPLAGRSPCVVDI